MRSALPSLFSLVIFVSLTVAAEQPKAAEQPAVNIPALIDKFVEVADGDIGYSASITGSSFLPLDHQGYFGMGLLFQKPSVPSKTMREIVKQGAAAMPHLIARLDDKRKTKIIIQHDGGAGGMFYGDEYDYNRRTTRLPSALARREDAEEEDGPAGLFGRTANQPHTVTVGDLCFVALGQIVNRRFNAVRYQPTAIIILSSPTHSPALLAAVKQEWGALTPEHHRASLIADLLTPDSQERCIQACRRLAYYYPDDLEQLIVPFLAQPTYDDSYSVSDIKSFVRETLYRTKDARKSRELFEAYLAKKGRAYRDGILQQLFKDLETLEFREAVRIWPPSFGTQPRELLIELYGYRKNVHSSQRPRHPDAVPASEKARLINEGLIYDRSVKIDRTVRDLLASIDQNDSLALACMRRLIGRGHDADIEKYCRRRLPQIEGDERKEMQGMLDRLGWNLVHVAVERQDGDGLRTLIAEGADLQAKARNGMTPLHLAAALGDGASRQLLLNARVALDPKNNRGETPVQLAARADHDEIVRFLVQKGCAVSDILTAAIVGQRKSAAILLSQDAARIDATTAHKRTPLHLAARWGHASVTELLLDKGTSVNVVDADGWTPLLVAIASRHESVARLLLNHKADIKAKLPDGGPYPLHLAVQSGDAKLVRLLLSYKADVNAAAGAGPTPLHLAAVKGDPALVELLLEAGAAIEARDEQGRTPLHVVAEWGQAEAARVLLEHKADVAALTGDKKPRVDYQPLHLAAMGGHVAVMEMLLAHKADLRAIANRWQMPLHLAAQGGHIDAVRWLLKHGADVNECAKPPLTPLNYAASDGRTDMVRFLLDNKAVIHDSTPDDWGPLMAAGAFGHWETVRLLLERKPNLSARDRQEAWHSAISSENPNPGLIGLLLDCGAPVDEAYENGQTPLHRFAAGKNVSIARVLLDHKANVRAALKETGDEPLHSAASTGSVKMVALLLDRGADINARQKSDGLTPLHCAIAMDSDRRSRLTVIALLLERKADYTIEDEDGVTPLAFAIGKKRPEIVQLLRKHGAKK